MACFVSMVNICPTCTFESSTPLVHCPSCTTSRIVAVPRLVKTENTVCPECGKEGGPFTGTHRPHCIWSKPKDPKPPQPPTDPYRAEKCPGCGVLNTGPYTGSPPHQPWCPWR